tara:strand:- start:382 stop:567 length:186 start_codon:yes stop_codon:yes gene_type:complete
MDDRIITIEPSDTIDEAKGIYTEVILKQLELGVPAKNAIENAVEASNTFITTFQDLEFNNG